MAQATISITYDDPLTGFDADQHSQWVYGTVAVSAGPSTYATGGIGTAAAAAAINWVVGDFPKVANLTPRDVQFYSVKPTGTTIGGFGYLWHKANNSFIIMASTTVVAGTGAQQQEMTTGTAIPANISNDVIRFMARFSRSMSGF